MPKYSLELMNIMTLYDKGQAISRSTVLCVELAKLDVNIQNVRVP